MDIILESILGIVILYIFLTVLGLIIPIVSIPLTYIVSLIEKKIRGEVLPIYNTFRIDHFINFFLIGLLGVFISSYIFNILPWEYKLNAYAIIVICLLKILGYKAENGFWYEVSLIGGGLLGLIFGFFFVNNIQLKHNTQKNSNNEILNCSSIEKLSGSNKGIEIIKAIKDSFSFEKIEILNFESIDLNNSKIKDIYQITYSVNNEDIGYYHDVFLKDKSLKWKNIFHEIIYYYSNIFSSLNFIDKNYLIKTLKEGSGSFLSFEMYKLIDSTKLEKIFEIPKDIDCFQGDVYINKNEILFSLASKKYILTEIENEKLILKPYNKRLKFSELNTNEHLLRINRNNDNKIEMIFNNELLGFFKWNGEGYAIKEPIPIKINDIIWIDDNNEVPLKLRLFPPEDFKLNSGIFNSFIVSKKGKSTFLIYEAYNTLYHIRFIIN